MQFYIDCEFDGFGGSLLSMAIVSESGAEFYEVLHWDYIEDAWVSDNVIPFLNKESIGEDEFRNKLIRFILEEQLKGIPSPVTLISDWPDDIMYFMKYITAGPGMIDPNIRYYGICTETIFGVRYKSKIPHNALADARAIKEKLAG